MKKEASQSKDRENFKSSVIFAYSTEHLLKKDKVRFYYALKGRDGKTGIVKRCNIEQLGRTVLLVPNNNAEDARGFLKFWRCEYCHKEVLLK